MKIFLSFHYDIENRGQEQFVCRVSYYLRKQVDVEIYCYTGDPKDEHWRKIVGRAVKKCDKFVLFVGRELGPSQKNELNSFLTEHRRDFREHALSVNFANACQLPDELFELKSNITVNQSLCDLGADTFSYDQEEVFESEAQRCAKKILEYFLKKGATGPSGDGRLTWIHPDGLPIGYPFGHEKQIIEEFVKGKGHLLSPQYLAEGCPIKWPKIIKIGEPGEEPCIPNPIPVAERGDDRQDGSSIIVDVRGCYHSDFGGHKPCLAEINLIFPEAGPRGKLFYPHKNRDLKVAIVVSGGIAPGINAVIAGIVQRHSMYHKGEGSQPGLEILMYRDGFDGIARGRKFTLNETILKDQSTFGGSMINTSLYDDLLEIKNLRKREVLLQTLVRKLAHDKIDILYVIGGDGSMRAAHAIWTRAQEMFKSDNHDRKVDRQLSVIAIPKTKDNDVLWVWQSLGFLSAVEKAQEFIVQLNTEAKSNPRLCIVQLFGSDSGFVVSHAALASGACMAALIPEVNFTMRKLSSDITKRMQKKYEDKDKEMNRGQSPYGLVLLGETAIPQDVEDYIDNSDYPDLGLEEGEKEAIRRFVGSSLLCREDVRNWESLTNELRNPPDNSPGKHILSLLLPEARALLEKISDSSANNYKSLILFAINQILKEDKFYEEKYFRGIKRTTEMNEAADILDHVKKMTEIGSESFEGGDIKLLVQKLKTVPISCEAREIVNQLEIKSRNEEKWKSIHRQDNLSFLQQLEKRLIEKINRLLLEGVFSDQIIARSSSIQRDRRVHGQTPDELRTGGLKIVSRVLKKDIRKLSDPDMYWCNYRVFVNEPRHLIRATAPSVSDIIFGQRLGIYAVDNAMAGCTDFMVSQWLTQYVLVPLKLAVLGRRRVPHNGYLWKSVLAGTGQAPEMT